MGFIVRVLVEFVVAGLAVVFFRKMWVKLSYKLGENAVLTFIDDVLAAMFGISEPSPSSAAAAIWDWTPPLLGALGIVLVVHAITGGFSRKDRPQPASTSSANIWGVATSLRSKVEPTHLQIAGLVGVILFAIIALGGTIWQARRVTPEDPRIASLQAEVDKLKRESASLAPQVPQTTSNATLGGGGTVAAPSRPGLSNDHAAKVARYIKLADALALAKAMKAQLEATGAAVEGEMQEDERRKKAGQPPIFRGSPYVSSRGRWNSAIFQIKKSNDDVFAGRAIVLDRPTDLAYMAFPVPGEEVFNGDIEKVKEFRYFHYLNISALKQTDSLINELVNAEKDQRESVKQIAPSILKEEK
jgi:hypothetical protein